jgi:hypothetical protein
MTWADGFTAYLASYEVRYHRRTNTFGGVLWPPGLPGLITEKRQLEIAVAAMERRTA